MQATVHIAFLRVGDCGELLVDVRHTLWMRGYEPGIECAEAL